MIEIELGPQHGLKQSVDYPLSLVLGSAWNITTAYSARMSLRAKLTDETPLAHFSTQGGTIGLVQLPEGAVRLTVLIDGDVTRTLDVRASKVLIDGREFSVLKTSGTLILTGSDGRDHPQAMDLKLNFEASFTREL